MRRLMALCVLAAVVGAGGCAPQDDAAAQGSSNAAGTVAVASPTVLNIDAADFSFAAPDSIPSGWTEVHLVNRGPSLHHVQMVRIDDGHTLDDLLAAVSEHGPPPSWIQEVGGPNAVVPGSDAVDYVQLEPGLYAITCFIPDSAGVPHIARGMIRPLVVTAQETGAPEPTADATVRLVDYGFEVEGAMTAGHHTIHVVNGGQQPHEVLLVRLAPGKTPEDFAKWTETMQGQPPAMPLGGTTGMEPGDANDMTADLEPGEYGLLCFLPDAKDGKPHVMHGMMKQFTVE